MRTMWDKIVEECANMKRRTWEEDFVYRVRTGGTDQAATLFANGFHPEDQRPMPTDQHAMTGAPPAPITPTK